MILYNTLQKRGQAEQVIKGSHFIATAAPVSSYEEAQEFVSEIRSEHGDATHNVPAIVCGDSQEIQYASDDGEPGGTSGTPILRLLLAEGLTDLAIVVTRYFGGIKLGTGRLVRAYSSSARLGIKAAGIAEVKKRYIITYRLDYASFNRAEHITGKNFEILNKKFADAVLLSISCNPEDISAVEASFNNISGGKCEMIDCCSSKLKVPLNGKEQI